MLKKITKKQWWMMLASALIIVGALIITNIVNQPKDLGDKLEYIGKKNTACEWWQVPLFMGWCHDPKYDYYFATDLSKANIETYFKNAVYKGDSQTVGADYNYDIVMFEMKDNSRKSFELGYTDAQNTQSILGLYKSFATKKKHLVIVSGDDLSAVQKALK